MSITRWLGIFSILLASVASPGMGHAATTVKFSIGPAVTGTANEKYIVNLAEAEYTITIDGYIQSKIFGETCIYDAFYASCNGSTPYLAGSGLRKSTPPTTTGQVFSDFVSQKPPYNPNHVYTVKFKNTAAFKGETSFWALPQNDPNPNGDYQGSFDITLETDAKEEVLGKYKVDFLFTQGGLPSKFVADLIDLRTAGFGRGRGTAKTSTVFKKGLGLKTSNAKVEYEADYAIADDSRITFRVIAGTLKLLDVEGGTARHLTLPLEIAKSKDKSCKTKLSDGERRPGLLQIVDSDKPNGDYVNLRIQGCKKQSFNTIGTGVTVAITITKE